MFTCIGSIITSLYIFHVLPLKTENIVLFAIGFGLPTVIGIILALSSSIAFGANVIQFGMDQLHDSPSEDSALFIHWFVFTSHLGVAINKFIFPNIIFLDQYIPNTVRVVIRHAAPLLALILLGVSLAIAHYKREWFLIDSGSRNPYRLVYKVIKFAAQHKSPTHRSAFTYCEDELPSRMDLAKEKYGGPFTTEQVKDVKAFLEILRVLLTFGPVFIINIGIDHMLPVVSLHLDYNISTSNNMYGDIFHANPDIMIAVLIPIHICVVQPFIRHYIPGMLKCMGLGMALLLLSGLSTLLIDTIQHLHHLNKICFLSTNYI